MLDENERMPTEKGRNLKKWFRKKTGRKIEMWILHIDLSIDKEGILIDRSNSFKTVTELEHDFFKFEYFHQ